MKKLLFLFALLFMGAMTAFAQVPVNEQLTYQTVVRNAQNKLVFSQDNVSVTVEVCKLDGSVVWYSENHTGLSTNANGLLTLMVGGGTPASGAWTDIDWSDAAIRTTVSYDPGSGTVSIPSGLAPVTAVPYALQAGNAAGTTINIGDAIHDSIVNNISEQIHDSIVNNLANSHYVTETVMGNAIHDSIVGLGDDLTDLANRVNTFNTHVCDSVQDCIKNYLTNNHYVTETVMGSAIHDSITNNVTNTISSQIHDSIVNISGDLTDLENRVNTFNTHVCDSVQDCVTGWIHDSIAKNISDNISSQIHDSLVYNINNTISEQIHDSVSNYLTNNHYVTETSLCTTIETNCTNVALRNGNTFTGDHDFTGAGSVTVPNAITPDLATALAAPCNQEAVNLCDLLAVFDSLNHRINELADEITALKNSIPPAANAPTVSNVTYTSMNVKANASSQGAAITSYEFCYSINSDMSGATCQTVLASDADNYTFTGLTPYTQYYVQYSATNFAGTTPSPIVMAHTPAHAPTADVTPPTTTKPAGFKVEVENIDPKEKTDETTVQVCYTLKTGTDCPEKESADYAECKTVDATGITDTTISVIGLTPSTEYCAIVKVSNGDSTTLYGPWSVTTGEDVTLSITQTGGGTVKLCGKSSVEVTYTATPSEGDSYTYSWSGTPASTSDNTATYSYTSAGTYTVTVTATHTSPSYTLTATASTTVNNGGTAISIGFCENDGVVSVKGSPTGNPNHVEWGDGQSFDGPVSESIEPHNYSTLGTGSHDVTITASNADGCTLSRTMTVTVLGSGFTAADRTVKPCSVSASHDAQTGTDYTGKGHNGANHGLETVNGSGQITSVTDYDGNAYPVVQIGSQCWMAENLRCSHSPKTGSNIVVTAVPNYVSKMAAWYDNDKSTYEPKRYGLLYNWCAAMDTAKPSDGSYTYVEVATVAYTGSYFDFTPSDNHQGVCPMGWHVPTITEWTTMVTAAGVVGSGPSGTGSAKLTTGCDWNSGVAQMETNNGVPGNYSCTNTNESGFSAVPAGTFTDSFGNVGDYAYFWTSSKFGNSNAWGIYLRYNYGGLYQGDYYKRFGYSVRCVRD